MTKSKFDHLAENSESRHWQTIKNLSVYLWPPNRLDLKKRVVFSLIALIVGKLVNICVPFLYKEIIDSLSPDQLSRHSSFIVPVMLIVAYGVARVTAQGFGELRDFIFARVAQFAQRTVGIITFRHLHNLSMSFHLDRYTGGLARIIERGTRGVQTVLHFMLFNIFPTIVEIVLVVGILLVRFPPSFGIVTGITIVIYICFTLIISNWRVQFRQRMNQRDSEANSKAIDSLLNFETVKYFTNELHEEKRFDEALAGYEEAAVQSQGTLSILNMGQGIIISAGLISVMYLASIGVSDKILTVGDFVLLNTFLIQLYLPLNFLGFVYRESKQSLIDMDKMFELLYFDPEIRDQDQAQTLKLESGQVEFKNVCFSYKEDRKILKGISFKVSSGRSLAIVGSSGAGKSTISRLLYRFYDPTSGEILIDGQNIQDIQQKSLRSAIGIVPQDTVLFNDSIEYNIRYGRPSATEKEVVEAAKMARIDDFVQELPQKYNTRVGERGLKLSGGEKQRVAIARTILKDPKILIFDEATSALDTKTEREIQESLVSMSRNRTTIIIAHRLSTVVDCDEIIVLKEGQVIEKGSHSYLLGLNGEYAQMWAKQQEQSSQL